MHPGLGWNGNGNLTPQAPGVQEWLTGQSEDRVGLEFRGIGSRILQESVSPCGFWWEGSYRNALRSRLTQGARTTRILFKMTFRREEIMPQYTFLCRACKKEFSRILTLSEHEKGRIVCPLCKSKDVEQRWAAFYAVTSKKS